MNNKFFLTTPIYYTNGIPHIGHSYSSLIADTIARYQKVNGKKVKFSTGVDENSQKAVLKAQEQDMDIMSYLDLMAGKHKAVWDGLNINYTDFIRTTEKRHHDFVKSVLQKSWDNGDIYEGVYEGMYCVGCEAFKKDEDLILVDGKKVCPDHLVEPQKLKEKNYFFRLSKYQDFLLDLYSKNKEFVIPYDRFNEVIAFVNRGLDDFSISRETNKFGITLPFDDNQVTYVWYDALFNYLTVCQNGDDDFWPADLHIVGKDIIRFHAIYWPAMLKSAGYDIPKQILTTGFFTIDGQKISKSLGNVIDPVEFCNKYNKDLLELYLFSSFHIGQDGDFDEKQAILTYNAKLANNLGNLLNRVIVLSLKLKIDTGYLFGEVDEMLKENNLFLIEEDLQSLLKGRPTIFEYLDGFKVSMSQYDLKGALDITFSFLDKLNKYTDIKEPWKMIKDDSILEETRNVLFTIAEGLRVVGLNLYCFFPDKMGDLFLKLGLNNYGERLGRGELNLLLSENTKFKITEKGENLYSRFEVN
ncbi:MAG: methionine--tRNA ligase [Candidatus Gracilibacteria bacterium]|nr:methionine--tRNA ligase [Candidatus Gracilibacteria bacterium]